MQLEELAETREEDAGAEDAESASLTELRKLQKEVGTKLYGKLKTFLKEFKNQNRACLCSSYPKRKERVCFLTNSER